MATKQLETVTGLVEQVNANGTGVKVGGQWLNVSQYRPLAQLPEVGQRVNVEVERTDRGAWIQAVEVLDGGTIHALPRRNQTNKRTNSDPRDIRRLAVLKAAAAFGASRPDVKSADVLAIAERWLAWVEQPPTKERD